MAERQVARRAKRQKIIDEAVQRQQERRALRSTRQAAGQQLNAAIKARHEDWELGPLAPRRDVSKVDTGGNFDGTISADHARLEAITLRDEQREARAAWAGGATYLCLSRGDRVVVLDGPYKGKISTIRNIHKDSMTLDLDNDLLVR